MFITTVPESRLLLALPVFAAFINVLKFRSKRIDETLLQVQGQRIMKLIDREVTILKSVSHENIIELKDVFETAQVR